MSILKSPISMAVLVAFFYILTTWALKYQWENSVTPTEMPALLRILWFPIPMIIAGFNGGTITFWSVLMQGFLLGGLVYLTIKARLIKKG